MAEAALARGTLCALRTEISRLEGINGSALARAAREDSWDGEETESPFIATGAGRFDAALGGGILRSALHEIRSQATMDNGAASGFALALARLALGSRTDARILWISDPLAATESGRPYGPGLAAHGLAPCALIHAAPRHLQDALMIAEAALAVRSFAAVILEIYGNPQKFGLTESRRLHLRARAHRRPILLLRERGDEEASSAVNRFLVRPFPAAAAILPDGRSCESGLGHSVFHVTIEKSRNPALPEFLLEWNADDCLLADHVPYGLAVPQKHAPEDPVALVSLPADGQDRAQPMGTVLAYQRAS